MPRKEYGYDVREQAEALYIEDGLTFDEAAQATGVGITTLKIWAKQGRWTARKRERKETRRLLMESMERLRVSMMQKAVASEDPQAVYAAVKLESLALQKERERKRGLADKAPDVDKPRLFLETLEFCAEYLKEHDPQALKALGRNFEGLVAAFKESLN